MTGEKTLIPCFILKHKTNPHEFMIMPLTKKDGAPTDGGWWMVAFYTLQDASDAKRISAKMRGGDDPMEGFNIMQVLEADFWVKNYQYLTACGVHGLMIIKPRDLMPTFIPLEKVRLSS